VTTVKNGKCSVKKHGLGDACNLHCTAIPRYNAVRLALIRYYPAIAFQPFLGVTRFPPYVPLFVSTFSTFKLKLSHYTPWRRLGEKRYSSYSFSTPALDGGEWSTSRPGRALAPGERTPGTHCTEPVWTQRLEEKSSRLCRGSNFNCLVVQPAARQYTDWATRLTLKVDSHLTTRRQTTLSFKCFLMLSL
jgi:hypothetical protein